MKKKENQILDGFLFV